MASRVAPIQAKANRRASRMVLENRYLLTLKLLSSAGAQRYDLMRFCPVKTYSKVSNKQAGSAKIFVYYMKKFEEGGQKLREK